MAANDGAQYSVGTRAERMTLQKLRHLIERSDFREGDKLPPERTLSKELGVSRRLLRNAFAVLESEGKIWRGVGQGTFVGTKSPKDVGDLVTLAQASNPVAVIEARLALEPICARFAAQRATSEHLSLLKRCAEESGRARSFAEFDRWDERFHRTIVDATGNNVFQAMHSVIRSVWSEISWGDARTRNFTAEWHRIYARQHRVIGEAIENRDLVRAENLTLEHWQTMRANLTRDPVAMAGAAS